MYRVAVRLTASVFVAGVVGRYREGREMGWYQSCHGAVGTRSKSPSPSLGHLMRPPSHGPGFQESVVPADKAALIGVYGYRYIPGTRRKV